jgi:biopolymer transport protein ExbD
MRKEAFFRLNRLLLLAAVLFSVLIPAIKLPQFVKPAVEQVWVPAFPETVVFPTAPPAPEFADQAVATLGEPTQPAVNRDFSWITIAQYGYLAGIGISLLVLIYGIASVLLIFRRGRMVQMDGFRLLIVDGDIAPFSFGRFVVISQADYDVHQQTILTHEEAHIRLNHFVDLALLETAKLFHWFNPVMYWLIRDLKEIHEYQADQYTLQKGVDATQYQFLIIQKSVGQQRFALANSFNHCQIKKRITMMTKQKTSKAALWKVATFLPLLALLLMAFSKPGEKVSEKVNVPEKIIVPPEIVQENQNDLSGRLIEIRKDGNYINNKLCTLEEIVTTGKAWGKASNDWIHLQIDELIPYNRIDEILEQLEPEMYHITQSTINSDDIVYFAGDVSESAKFTQGKWSDWILSQLNNSHEIKFKTGQYKIAYGFIVDRNGKVRDAHLTKRCDLPEVNAAFEKILTQVPDWEPAKRGSSKVSAYYRFVLTRYVPPVVKK